MDVVGVHGLFSDGALSVDLLLDHLATWHTVHDFDHRPRTPLLAALHRSRNGRRLRRVGANIAIAHSFGCSLVVEAMRQGAYYDRVYLFNPALPADLNFPFMRYGKITVVANEADTVLGLADLFLSAAGYGDMGKIGYLGKSERVTTFHGPTPEPSELSGFRDHGKAFSPENLVRWAQYIHNEITLLETAA